MTTGIDKQTDPAVMDAAVLPTPAIPSAKKITAATAMADVNLIAYDKPSLLASISALVSLAAFSTGPEIVISAMARIRIADPGTTLS
jgi:hypothetical protein